MWSRLAQLGISVNSLSLRNLQPVRSKTSNAGVFWRKRSDEIRLSDKSSQYKYLHFSNELSIKWSGTGTSKWRCGSKNLLKQHECCNILSMSQGFTLSSESKSKNRHSTELSSMIEFSRLHVLFTTCSKYCKSRNFRIDITTLSGRSVILSRYFEPKKIPINWSLLNSWNL